MSSNYRDRDGKREHSGDGTSRADELSDRAHRNLVSVSHRGHRDDRPPEGVRDALHL